MDYFDLTKEEKRFSYFMLFSGTLFAVISLVFIFIHIGPVELYFHGLTSMFDTLVLSRFWGTFIATIMIAFSVLSLLVAFDVRLYKNYVLPILIIKAFLIISSLVIYAISFFSKSYILVFLMDIPLFLFMWFFYIRVVPFTVSAFGKYRGMDINHDSKKENSSNHNFLHICSL